jgi:hypothetical protein
VTAGLVGAVEVDVVEVVVEEVEVVVEPEEAVLAEVPPATLAVPLAHTAAGAAMSRTTMLTSVEPRARTRKTTSSFVGLRG